jgi:hypothetical protein
MSVTIALGTWFIVNAAVAAALLSRRKRPGLRERLSRWVCNCVSRPSKDMGKKPALKRRG